MKHPTGRICVKPEAAIDVIGSETIATSSEPWLRVEPVDALNRRRWVSLRYSSNYFDDPVRPIVRFDTQQGRRFMQFMNGPVLGAGEWIGRIPDHATAISISAVNSAGPFAFRLDSVQNLARRDLIRRGLVYDRSSLLSSLGAKFLNARDERWELLKFAASATPLKGYAEWYARLYRRIDIDGLDHPRNDWRSAPVMRLVMPLDRGDPKALTATLASLRQQVYQRWSLYGLASKETSHEVLSTFLEESARDRRLVEISDGVGFSALASDLDEHDGFAIAEVGDLLPDHALAVLADSFAGQPDLRVVYGDEDSIAANGKLHSPIFKPDWSPAFFESSPYIGRLTCVRAKALVALQLDTIEEFYRHETTVLNRLAKSSASYIGHVRRIVYRRQRELNETQQRPTGISSGLVRIARELPEVCIVIPTRDRADLLAQCVNSLRSLTDYPPYRLVIVDNGSRKPDALALLYKFADAPNCQVVKQPGAFNYSALCNAGSRVTVSPLLVFLNNDIVVIDGNWLNALVAWAMKPDIGVVGPKLLFPNKTIEHAGVVLGHTSLAGHIYLRQPSEDAGYLNQLLVPREVEAVTGACLAIERKKFEAIGGFDENLKVEFNDTDLCLRVSERGWRTIWTPEATLTHLQSATRGRPMQPSRLFRDDHEYFRQRWLHRLRDDRYFHPALSLFSHRPALA